MLMRRRQTMGSQTTQTMGSDTVIPPFCETQRFPALIITAIAADRVSPPHLLAICPLKHALIVSDTYSIVTDFYKIDDVERIPALPNPETALLR